MLLIPDFLDGPILIVGNEAEVACIEAHSHPGPSSPFIDAADNPMIRAEVNPEMRTYPFDLGVSVEEDESFDPWDGVLFKDY